MRSPITVFFYDRSRRNEPDRSGSFDAIIKTLGGIAATIAVFAALLSVFGFLLLRAHSNLLGLSNFLDHAVTDYLYEGGGFVGYSLYSMLALFVRHIYFFVIASALFFAAKLISRRIGLRKRLSKLFGEPSAVRRKLLAWVCVVLAAISILFFTYRSLPSAEASNLLFMSGNQDEKSERTDARIEEMESAYLNALAYFLLSGAALLLACSVVRNANAGELMPTVGAEEDTSSEQKSGSRRPSVDRTSAVGQAILFLLAVFQLSMLPGIYGQTVYSNNFHKVKGEIVLGDALKAGSIPSSDSVWLIKENPEYFIFYYRDDSMLRLIRKEEVKSLTLGGRENIFNR